MEDDFADDDDKYKSTGGHDEGLPEDFGTLVVGPPKLKGQGRMEDDFADDDDKYKSTGGHDEDFGTGPRSHIRRK